jgi:SPP1 gp7 family putative phage head morphogenesis protein
MWNESDFINLEQEELEITEEELVAMLAILSVVKSDLEKELRDFYSRYGKDGVVTWKEARKWISEKDHRRRFTVLLLFIGDKFDSAFSEWAEHFRKFLVEVAEKESEFFGVPIDIDKILYKKWDVNDLYWLERFEYDVDLWKATILNDIKQAIKCGDSLDSILEKLEKRTNSIESVLTTLALSESTAIGSFARQGIFKKLGIGKYQIYTKNDERRCETCGAMHGRIFPMNAYEVGVTASPFHKRCRCWEVPILE